MTDIKNWLINKLGGITQKEARIIEDDARKGLGGGHGGHTIHFPEFKDKNGRTHLHLCPMGNWKNNDKEQCVPIPFERNESGVLVNSKPDLKDNKSSETSILVE